jgi:hypothetical protein
MKTATVTTALTIAFLSAGAFANNPQPAKAPVKVWNVTVIKKNQAWPIKPRMTMESCKLTRCIDV